MSTLRKNPVMAENHLSLIIMSPGVQKLLVPSGVLTGRVPPSHENTLRRFMPHFVFKTEMKKKCQIRMALVLCQLLCLGYVHDPTLKLLTCLPVKGELSYWPV